MENASKALVIAGSVLLAILIIGAATFMFRDVTSTQKEQDESIRVSQINEFNKQFTSYEKELYGHELLSLVNKIENYNTKIDEEKNGYSKMKIVVNKVKVGGITGNITYTPTQGSNPFSSLLEAKSIASSNGVSEENFQRLVTLWEDAKTSDRVKTQLDQLLQTIGKKETDFKDSDIKKYTQYLDFKRTKFTYTTTGYDSKTGRVNAMTYQQK